MLMRTTAKVKCEGCGDQVELLRSQIGKPLVCGDCGTPIDWSNHGALLTERHSGIKRRALIAFTWSVATLVLLAPYGLISGMLHFGRLLDETAEMSPIREICYVCSGPATHSVNYTHGRVLHLCSTCPAPLTTGAHGGRDSHSRDQAIMLVFTPIFIGVMVTLYVGNSLRSGIHLVSEGRYFAPTQRGATIGLCTIIGLWALRLF